MATNPTMTSRTLILVQNGGIEYDSNSISGFPLFAFLCYHLSPQVSGGLFSLIFMAFFRFVFFFFYLSWSDR